VLHTVTLATASPEATEEMGEAWGRVLVPGDVLLLVGTLGTGKTTLVRGLARGLGIPRGVKSPTFALHLPHPGRLLLHHLDLYRIGDPGELRELGIDEVLSGDGVSVVEWGERLGDLAPSHAVRVLLEETGPTSRRWTVIGPADAVDRLARSVGGTPRAGGSAP
jgi:tRNA threonylcarbamoyladenosine biosynthesis protein TsaE